MIRRKDNAYVLHLMPYRESSAIVRLLSVESGLVSGVVRGVAGKRRQAAASRSALQTGNLIELEWSGNSSLKNLSGIALLRSHGVSSARDYLCLSYVNELLSLLLPEEQPEAELFACYGYVVEQLAAGGVVEPLLRRFEWQLLERSGYGVDFTHDTAGHPVETGDCIYTVDPTQGVRQATAGDRVRVRGGDLLALSQQDFSRPEILPVAKQVNRLLIDHLLEGRELKSRKMYQELFGQT